MAGGQGLALEGVGGGGGGGGEGVSGANACDGRDA